MAMVEGTSSTYLLALQFIMIHKPNMDKLNAEKVEGLVEKNELNQALNLFKNWAGVSHHETRKEVITMKGRLSEIKRNERLGLVSFEEVLRSKSKLAYDILSLLEDITSDHLTDPAYICKSKNTKNKFTR
jgi:hypothetical protein